jgi:hypothetical protein
MAQAAELVTEHMAAHALPEPASLLVVKTLDDYEVRVQAHTASLAQIAAVLLRWANSLTGVAVRTWRATEDSVHLDVDTTLTGTSGAVKLTIYGGVRFDPVAFAGLEIRARRAMSLGQLTEWATTVAGVAA